MRKFFFAISPHNRKSTEKNAKPAGFLPHEPFRLQQASSPVPKTQNAKGNLPDSPDAWALQAPQKGNGKRADPAGTDRPDKKATFRSKKRPLSCLLYYMEKSIPYIMCEFITYNRCKKTVRRLFLYIKVLFCFC